MRRLIAALLVTLALLPALRAAAYPEPAIVSPSWQLDFRYQAPRAVAVPDVDGQTRWYWYIPYTVVNNTGDDRLFIPEVTIATDTGRIFPANYGVPGRVFDAVQRQTRNALLQSPLEIVGKLLQGEDYAKDGVIIWPAFEGDVDEFRVFIAGLSGENATATNPATGEPVLMQRTRMMQFATPGGPNISPERQPVNLVGETDVMR